MQSLLYRTVLTLLVSTLCTAVALCQAAFEHPDNSHYFVSKTEAKNFFFITNKENQLKDRANDAHANRQDLIEFSHAQMQLSPLVKSVLGESFGKSKRDYLIVFFCVSDQGKVLEVEYGVQNPNRIPLSKLAELEGLLKEKLLFKAKNESLSQLSFIRFGMATTSLR